ncbi:putative F-box protein [Salvia divinorum]|uniref:F-box protein n=1 Tax=Salvia divinorum TaxID=28513 RepID=A0ABD1GFZ6_SALDI
MSSEPNHHRTLCRDVGIWFDEVAQDYVVVQVLFCHSLENGFHLHASVYSKATNSWRGLTGGSSVVGHGLCGLSPINSSCKNGSFSHWLAIDKDGNEVILSFDFRNEGFRILEIADLGILKLCGDMKIFAEGDDSFLMFVPGDRKAPTRLNIFWLRIEGNKLHWDGMKSVGPFDGLVMPKALCERGCVVLQSKTTGCFLLYDYCNKRCVKCFEMKKDLPNIFEYRGSFVLP